MTTIKLQHKRTDPVDGRGIYVLSNKAGCVYITRAIFADGKMPATITLEAEGLLEDRPVPEAEKKQAQIEKLRAQLAKLEGEATPALGAYAQAAADNATQADEPRDSNGDTAEEAVGRARALKVLGSKMKKGRKAKAAA